MKIKLIFFIYHYHHLFFLLHSIFPTKTKYFPLIFNFIPIKTIILFSLDIIIPVILIIKILIQGHHFQKSILFVTNFLTFFKKTSFFYFLHYFLINLHYFINSYFFY